MRDTKKLIAEARGITSSLVVQELMADEDRQVIDELADALETVTAERDSLAAVIAEAFDVAKSGSVPLGVPEALHYDRLLAEIRRALIQSPSTVLADRDARVLEAAARGCIYPIDPYGGFDPASLNAARTQITNWLRVEAARIREEGNRG